MEILQAILAIVIGAFVGVVVFYLGGGFSPAPPRPTPPPHKPADSQKPAAADSTATAAAPAAAPAASAAAAASSAATTTEQRPPDVTIIYASQRGHAKETALQLEQLLRPKLGPFRIETIAIQSLNSVEDLKRHKRVLFVVATYEGGTPPKPAAQFATELVDLVHDFRVERDFFYPLRFAVFGIGDASYAAANFCRFAKDITFHFGTLGAERFIGTMCADEPHVAEAIVTFAHKVAAAIARDSTVEQDKASKREFIDKKRVDDAEAAKAKRIAEQKAEQQQQGQGQEKKEDGGCCGGAAAAAAASGAEGDAASGACGCSSNKKAKGGKTKQEGDAAAAGDDEEEDEDEDDEDAATDSDEGDIEEIISAPRKHLLFPRLRRNLEKQGYNLIGTHSAVKLCRWTKSALRGRGFCYKSVYAIRSHQCMEMTPSLACASKCVFCLASDDTELLAPEGWIGHAEVVRRWQCGTLVVAGFDADKQQLVYEAPTSLVDKPDAPDGLYDITASSMPSTHLSIRVTGNHQLLESRGTNPDELDPAAQLKWRKVTPLQYLAGTWPGKGPGKPVCDKTPIMLMSNARHGLAVPADYSLDALLQAEVGVDIADLIPALRQVPKKASGRTRDGASTKDDADLRSVFLNLFGFWTGDGSLNARPGGGGNGVLFSQVKDSDNQWIKASLLQMGLSEGKSAVEQGDFSVWTPGTSSSSSSGGEECTVHVHNEHWVRFFFSEYAAKYKHGLEHDDAAAVRMARDALRTQFPDEDPDNFNAKSCQWLPRWAFRLSGAHAKALLAGLCAADGACTAGTSSNAVVTASAHFRDQCERFALHAGFTVWTERRDAAAGSDSRGSIPQRDLWAVHYSRPIASAAPVIKRTDIRLVADYAGGSYCVTMPSTNIFVRRRATGTTTWRPMIVGNCWRHQTNPTARSFQWEHDPAEFLIEAGIARHQQMIRTMRGVPGVIPQRLDEAMTVRHCALSLVGEPIMYPEINKFVTLLHQRRISSFLVTNAQFPEEMERLIPCTQLYLSIDASTPEDLKAVDRPIHADYWERFMQCVKLLARVPQRTVFRLTLVHGYNTRNLKEYSDLVRLGHPDFVEVKGFTYCGASDASDLTIKNVPYHHEVVKFCQELCSYLPGYAIACEHEHSCMILIAKTNFMIEGKWHTWIDYDKFYELFDSGRTDFTALEYCKETPQWAVFGAPEHGFTPGETRHRKGKPVTGGGC